MISPATLPHLEPTWRWYGPNDTVTLSQIEQTGATGIVSALHHIPAGEVWPVAEIEKRIAEIEWDRSGSTPRRRNLRWSVVESVNIHESIKLGSAARDGFIEKYKASLQNLASCGISIVCYNFMPVLDWTRTALHHPLKDASTALRYDKIALAAFDLYLLKREAAAAEWSDEVKQEAREYLDGLSEDQLAQLKNTILAGLPGTKDVLTVEQFQALLNQYAGITRADLKENLAYFLREVTPIAEELGIKLCIHPDDPPIPILGLPRIVSTEEDLRDLLAMADSPANGLTFCAGSLGANPDNDLPGIVTRLGHRIHFIHLRSVQREENGSFYEANHLEGDSRLAETMVAIVQEQKNRLAAGREDVSIPFRPDHGHEMLQDMGQPYIAGYSLLGRMRGLSELRGLEEGVRVMMK